MKVELQEAIVSLCEDLTSPTAESRPVSVLLVGRAAGTPVAAYVYSQYRDDSDPITFEILRDVPDMLQRHLDQAFRGNEELSAVLGKLQHSLRNSLHVSEIKPQVTIELQSGDESELAEALVSHIMRTYTVARRAPAVAGLTAPSSAQRRASGPRTARPKMPHLEVWLPPTGSVRECRAS